jgi:hypothetical protein
MRYAEIQALLDAHLATVASLPELQLENTRNVGRSGQPFARATLVTTEPARVGLATRLGGLYVIDLFYPLDAGVPVAAAMADAVLAHFRSAPLHRLVAGDLVVQLEKEWRETIGRREPFYGLQVKVRWHCLV